MNLAETYRALAHAFAYPWDKDELLLSVARIARHLEETGRGKTLDGFAEFIARTDLAGIQEEYVSTFDLSPGCAPYVGHHLYGDNHKRGEYMILVKGIYRKHGYQPPEDELPDHLSVLFAFLAELSRKGADAERGAFLAARVLTGTNRMREAAMQKPDLHWKDLINAACILCAADCEEVPSC